MSKQASTTTTSKAKQAAFKSESKAFRGKVAPLFSPASASVLCSVCATRKPRTQFPTTRASGGLEAPERRTQECRACRTVRREGVKSAKAKAAKREAAAAARAARKAAQSAPVPAQSAPVPEVLQSA